MFRASFKLIQPCPLPANHVLLCYYCSLLSPCLVCMLRMLRCYPFTPWIGLSHYYIVVDDMIIIMLTIFDEGWKVILSRLGALFHSSHLGPEFRVGFTENTKLCDFTSYNNNDFICTPIAPPATSTPSYEIKPALLNLVMKDRFSNAGEDAALHLSFVICKSTRN